MNNPKKIDTYHFELLKERHINPLLNLEKIIFPSPWTVGMFKGELYSDYSNFYVLCSEDEIVAYFGLWTVGDEGHINNFAVTPEYRNWRVGSLMLSKIFEIGNEKQVEIYYLEVRVSNISAISLYKKHGFVEAGIRKKYYSSPREDALLMTKFV